MSNESISSVRDSLTRVAAAVRDITLSRVNLYCNKKLVEFGIISPQLMSKSCLELISGNVRNKPITSEMNRLRSFTEKYFLKKIPYLKDSVEFLSKQSTGTTVFVIRVGSAGSYIRYVRYLKYLCRKHGIPLTINAIVPGAGRNGITEITISQTVWSYMGNSVPISDEHYGNESMWANGTVDINFSTSAGFGSVTPSVTAPSANVFRHFDKVLKVINTLSRKVDYGNSAHTFRSV